MEEIITQTDRLILRHWKSSDLPLFVQMNADPKVMQYFPATLKEEETLQMRKRIELQFEQYGFGWYAAEFRETSEFIGFIGFHYLNFKATFTPCVEIGWRLRKDFWFKGLASEGAKACLEYGFEKLHFKQVLSMTPLQNARSERVMIKLGMHKLKEFNHPKIEAGHPLERHILYKITKQTHLAQKLS